MINKNIVRFNERQADIAVVQTVQREESKKEIQSYVADWRRASNLRNIRKVSEA